MERAHGMAAPRPGMDQLPRPVLIRFLRQSAWEKVLALAREKRGILWENLRLSVFPNVSRELVLKRKMFTLSLQRHNVCYKLAYPATLRFTWKGRSCSFTNAKGAQQVIEENSTTNE